MSDPPIDPATAVDEYLEARRHELSKQTVQNQRYRLKQFVEWADEIGFDDMRQLDGRDCEAFKLARNQSGLAPITITQQMHTFRVFIRWCGTVGYCPEDLHELIIIPPVSASEERSDDALSFERGQRILSYLRQFKYASRKHVLFGLLWHTGLRTGSARALDLGDIHHDESGTMYLDVCHRPETDTPLKLQEGGERHVTVANPELASAIDDWVDHKRPSVEDDYGREPLITSRQGRASHTTIRCDVYQVTHPCITDNCPHGNDKDTCSYRNRSQSGGCPSAVGPHGIRRSAITAHLDQGVPKEIVSERTNVNVDTLEKHYDGRTKEQARTTRQEHIDDLRF